MHIAREFFLGPPITSQLRQNKQFRGTHSIAHRAFGPIDVWDFFVGLPNVYTNVLGSQKENSIQSYRRTVVPHTLSLILLVYISHFSADTLTHKMSFVFFFSCCFFGCLLNWTSNFNFTSYTRPPSTNKWQIYRATNQPFYVSQFYYCL